MSADNSVIRKHKQPKRKNKRTSHVIGGDIKILDLEVLKEACKFFPELVWKEGQKTYRWYGSWVNDYHAADAAYKKGVDPKDYGKCDHAIECKGSGYDIGVAPLKEKSSTGKQQWTIIFDFYGTGRNIQNAIGKGGEKLLQKYNELLMRKTAKAKGWMVGGTKAHANGDVELTLTVGN